MSLHISTCLQNNKETVIFDIVVLYLTRLLYEQRFSTGIMKLLPPIIIFHDAVYNDSSFVYVLSFFHTEKYTGSLDSSSTISKSSGGAKFFILLRLACCFSCSSTCSAYVSV